MFVGHVYVRIVRVDPNKSHELRTESGGSGLIHLYIFPGSGLNGAPAPCIKGRVFHKMRPIMKGRVAVDLLLHLNPQTIM